MPSTNNLSPKQLSLFVALVLSLPYAALLTFLKSWEWGIFGFSVFYLSAFLLIRYVMEGFVYRKIKLIFKFINKTKANRLEKNFNRYILPRPNLEEASREVEQWAIKQDNEIGLLKKNEAYRKEFLQNLSHEIKTPIFSIQGYIDTVLSGDIDNPITTKKFLENASRNVTRLINLVKDIDEISRLESGEETLFKQNFIVYDLIKEVFEDLTIKFAQNKNIKCLFKKGTETHLQVFADREKIRQVLINLVENAIKYGKMNGTVTACIYNPDGENVLIEIDDDGIGIAEEHIPRIFERFYRTDRGRSRDVGGTGLGLAICKHIIEAHGNVIHVRSKLDVGTTIGFTLKSKNKV